MRWALLVMLVGCRYGTPTIEITAPPQGTTITDHGSALVTIDAFDVAPDRFELAIDGLRLEENLTVSPTPNGEYCDTCSYRIVWPTASVGEGLHVLTVFLFDSDTGEAAVDDVALTFDDVPEITAVSPQDEDLTGVGTVNVRMSVIERGNLSVDLQIDGTSIGTRTAEACRAGCDLTWTWDTRTIEAGPHELRFLATDAHGKQSEAKHVVQIDDLVRVSAIQVNNTVDASGVLEIEVYIYDNVTNAMLGCAGSMHGLGGVDVSGTRYTVDASIVDPTNTDLALRQLGTNAVRFEVWEDDDAPVCPSILNPQGNNLVGASPARTAAEWKAQTGPHAFGNVGELQLVIDRPLVR